MRLQKLAPLAVATALIASTLVPTTANAAPPPFRPNVAVTVIFASAVSVVLDGMYIAATQCREMTSQEAATATFLPGIGPIYNSTLPSMSRCNK